MNLTFNRNIQSPHPIQSQNAKRKYLEQHHTIPNNFSVKK